MMFGLLIIWYVPRPHSRFAVFIRVVPRGVAALGVFLHLLNLLCCFYIFVRFGLLVDATSTFIILSAVMGCFFSPALLHADEQARAETARALARESDSERTGNAPRS
jgi:hypothetical protein